MPRIEKECLFCNEKFKTKYPYMRYCSESCGNKYRKRNARAEYALRQEEIKRKNGWYSDISLIAGKARQHGLSYGEYCARFNVR